MTAPIRRPVVTAPIPASVAKPPFSLWNWNWRLGLALTVNIAALAWVVSCTVRML